MQRLRATLGYLAAAASIGCGGALASGTSDPESPQLARSPLELGHVYGFTSDPHGAEFASTSDLVLLLPDTAAPPPATTPRYVWMSEGSPSALREIAAIEAFPPSATLVLGDGSTCTASISGAARVHVTHPAILPEGWSAEDVGEDTYRAFYVTGCDGEYLFGAFGGAIEVHVVEADAPPAPVELAAAALWHDLLDSPRGAPHATLRMHQIHGTDATLVRGRGRTLLQGARACDVDAPLMVAVPAGSTTVDELFVLRGQWDHEPTDVAPWNCPALAPDQTVEGCVAEDPSGAPVVVRAGPSRDSSAVRTLSPGESLTLDGAAADGFTLVGGGWIPAELILCP